MACTGGYDIMRIGYGFDVHQLVKDRPLILGGVRVPFEKGLLGHSDADVLLHAIIDALLGAAALGDIGTHFPDTDPAWHNADSRGLLRGAVKLVGAAGLEPINIDATVVAERPKLAPFIADMRRCIAEDTGLDVSRVSVKATTSEQIGAIGRGEGICAMSVCLLQELKES